MGKVFVSYRRKDVDFTRHLVEKLRSKLYDDVFWDYDISEDNFERGLTGEIHACNVFVLVVSDYTFAIERIADPEDWIVREVALALKIGKPIVLALYEGKTPQYDLRNKLPVNIREIATKQGIPIMGAAFDASVDRLAHHCVNVSGGRLTYRPPRRPVPPPVKTYAEEQREKSLIFKLYRLFNGNSKT
jgi:hypothetical protein